MFKLIAQLICILVITVALTYGVEWDAKCLEEPISGIQADNCCKTPDLFNFLEVSTNKCLKSIYANATVVELLGLLRSFIDGTIFGKHIRCLTECIFNQIGLIKNDQLQADVAENLITGDVYKEWAPVNKAAFKECEKILATINFDDEEKDGCSYVPSFYVGCVDTQLFINCPADLWNDSAQCNQLRENATACPISFAIEKLQNLDELQDIIDNQKNES